MRDDLYSIIGGIMRNKKAKLIAAGGMFDRYISSQEHHHRKPTFKEELIGLLEKHGITYDKRYIWD